MNIYYCEICGIRVSSDEKVSSAPTFFDEKPKLHYCDAHRPATPVDVHVKSNPSTKGAHPSGSGTRNPSPGLGTLATRNTPIGGTPRITDSARKSNTRFPAVNSSPTPAPAAPQRKRTIYRDVSLPSWAGVAFGFAAAIVLIFMAGASSPETVNGWPKKVSPSSASEATSPEAPSTKITTPLPVQPPEAVKPGPPVVSGQNTAPPPDSIENSTPKPEPKNELPAPNTGEKQTGGKQNAGVVGRFVRIEKNGRAGISLAEVEVIGLDNKSLARGKNATQSKQYRGQAAKSAIDGNVGTECNTGGTTDPWWEVDLEREEKITSITLSDGRWNALKNARLLILKNDRTPAWSKTFTEEVEKSITLKVE